MGLRNFCGRAALIATVSLAASPAVLAATTATGTFPVTASVANSCRVSSTGVSFGAYTDAGLTNNAGRIQLTCNKGVTITSLLIGDGANALSGTKRMAGSVSGEFLAYKIDVPTGSLLDGCPAAGAGEWNATDAPTGAALTALFATAGGPKNIAICGSVPKDQFPAADNYADTITMTLTYN